MLKNKDNAMSAAKKEIQGTCFEVDYYNHKLKTDEFSNVIDDLLNILHVLLRESPNFY